MKNHYLAVLSGVLLTSSLYAGGGPTGFDAYSRFEKFACVNGDGSVTDEVVNAPVEPAHLILDLFDRSIVIGGYHYSSDNSRCWVELWGSLTSSVKITSVTAKDDFGLVSHDCAHAKAQFLRVIPKKTKRTWIDDDHLALDTGLSAQGVCAHPSAKIKAFFTFQD